MEKIDVFLEKAYDFCFRSQQFPVLEALQYIWACILVGNSNDLRQYFANFVQTLLIGVAPHFIIKLVFGISGNETDSYLNCFLFFSIIFVIFQFLPINQIAALHIPILVPAHAINVIRRFTFIIGNLGKMQKNAKLSELLLSACAALFISGCDTFLCFACRRISNARQSKYCDRMGFFRSISGCIFFVVGMIVFGKNEHYVALASSALIAILDFISIVVGEKKRQRRRSAKEHGTND